MGELRRSGYRQINPKKDFGEVNFIVSLQSMKIGQSVEVFFGHFLKEISIQSPKKFKEIRYSARNCDDNKMSRIYFCVS